MMVDSFTQLIYGIVIAACFNCNYALTYCRNKDGGIKNLGDIILQPEPDKPGSGHYDGFTMTLFHFLKARIYIAPDIDNLQITVKMQQGCLAAETGGADPVALIQFKELFMLQAYQRITEVSAFKNGAYHIIFR